MFPSIRHLHACALILLPPTADPDYSPEYKAQVRDVSMRMGIAPDWVDLDDIANFRHNFRSMPPLAEASRFNVFNQKQTRDMMGVAAKYRGLICDKRQFWPTLKDDFDYLEWEASTLYYFWDGIDDICGPNISTYNKRKALERIKKMLGEKDYAAGLIINPLPIWRFEETLP